VRSAMNSHEDYRRAYGVKRGSERGFGLLFAAAFLFIGFSPTFRGQQVRWSPAIVGALFVIVTIIWPRVLAPANQMWFGLSLALGRILTPFLLGLFFFLVVTPFGLIARFFKWDPMRRTYTRDASYWIPRDPPGPPPESIVNQF
jgi:hypothetical protein